MKAFVGAARKKAAKNAEERKADDGAGSAVVSNPESRPSTHTRDEEHLISSVLIPQPSDKISVTPSALVFDHEDNQEPDDDQDSQKMTDAHWSPAMHFRMTNGQRGEKKAPRQRDKRFPKKTVKRSRKEPAIRSHNEYESQSAPEDSLEAPRRSRKLAKTCRAGRPCKRRTKSCVGNQARQARKSAVIPDSEFDDSRI
ncbi:hypothetical protein BWQ96_02551 [Gracilariopsis chorda]|uniref:Uncharacterized protein n=1 Tax=Gracilariopsis chorda TaxID=448386 RepID=A0A2V3J015_9FLOR|nr:hypothetical protein BWQ96_02551 [Gracilariopsis chorda]|eukprot:PXF47689.1 hypothetical protein BWQ96_02551 [Gracilariopsis chorda]